MKIAGMNREDRLENVENDGEEQVKNKTQTIGPVLTGFGALYLVLALSQVLADPGGRSIPIIALTVATGIIFLAARSILMRIRLSARRAESVGAVFAGLVVLNGIVHFYLISGFTETRSLALLAVGIACFFLPFRRLILVLVVCLFAWVVLSWSWGTSLTWLNFAFGLFAATGLRIYTEFQSSKFEVALGEAETELARRKAAESALRKSQERYALAAQGSKDGLWDWDIESDAIFFSERWRAMLGYVEEIPEASMEYWQRLIHPGDVVAFREALQNHLKGESRSLETECRIERHDGSYCWVMIRGIAVRDQDEKPYRMAGSQTDIHERKLAEQELYHGAFHDPLTHLPNRVLFLERVKRVMERTHRNPGHLFGVLFMDFDRFKVINDSLGHLAGDELLEAIARRLEGCLRQVDTIARFGGDEFAILLDEISDSDDATACADRIHAELSHPFDLGGREVFATASIGIVLSSRDYQKPEELLRDADTAMYKAKVQGKARTELFSTEMHTQVMARWHLENDLRTALRDQQMRVWYQPIVSISTGEIVACEALVRWQHPAQGLLAPAAFLGTAEEAGMIVQLGWWVMKEACQQVQAWHEKYEAASNLGVSVNVAGAQLVDVGAAESIERVLNETGLDPVFLRLELTENGIRQFGESSRSTLRRLKGKGLQVYLDDFGTGYSSLAYLHRLPVDVAKIDRSFISGSESSDGNRQIVRAMANLLHELGMDVAVEGVETAGQLELARELGCEAVQGFFLAKPMEAQAFERFLAHPRLRKEIASIILN